MCVCVCVCVCVFLSQNKQQKNKVPYDDELSKFYVIIQGTMSNAKKDQGVVSHMVSGEYFGESALLSKEPNPCTVTVSSKSAILLSLSSKKFKKFLTIAPELVAYIQAVNTQRLHSPPPPCEPPFLWVCLFVFACQPPHRQNGADIGQAEH